MELLRLLCNRVSEILVVDHDRIRLTNLHRLAMFTREDEGEYKSQRAAEFMNRAYGGKAGFLTCRIEDVPIEVLDRYDVVLGALDNIEGRMNLNLMFRRSKCSLLIDCGISGYKAHAKAVYRGSSCLYCIRELYREEELEGICSLGNLPKEITPLNREKALRQLVELRRGGPRKEMIGKIVDEFNGLVDEALRTDLFHVAGMYDDIMPNVCFINSVCAGLACELLDTAGRPHDFLFYSGEEEVIFRKLEIGRDGGCIVCSLDA